MFRPENSLRGPKIPEGLIPNHPPGVEEALWGARAHAPAVELLECPHHLARRAADQAPDDPRIRDRALFGGEVSVRHAVVHQAHELEPDATRLDGASLERHITAPVPR